MTLDIKSKPVRIAALRRRIGAISTAAIPAWQQATGQGDDFSPGATAPGLHEVLDQHEVPGLHEVRPAAFFDTPAALGFAAALIAQGLARRAGGGLIVWRRGAGAAEFGTPYPYGLMEMGVDPARLLFVEARNAREALWCLEEGLRAGLALVAGDVGPARAYDLTASRRLDLAARAGAATALIMRSWHTCRPSVARTRFRVAASPGAPTHTEPVPHTGPVPHTDSHQMAALGKRRWRVELERARGAKPGFFDVQWHEKTHHLHLVAPLANRPARQPAKLWRNTG